MRIHIYRYIIYNISYHIISYYTLYIHNNDPDLMIKNHKWQCQQCQWFSVAPCHVLNGHRRFQVMMPKGSTPTRATKDYVLVHHVVGRIGEEILVDMDEEWWRIAGWIWMIWDMDGIEWRLEMYRHGWTWELDGYDGYYDGYLCLHL